MEKLKLGTKCVQNMDYEGALIEFNKVIFYDKNIPEVYAEKAEIYIKLCDFSSAIQQYKKALLIRNDDTWLFKMNQLYFMKGLTLIEEGYCNDALNLISTIETDDVKFTYLKALSYVRASNKDLAFVEIENCLAKDPNNVEVLILKGKLLWSIDKVDLGNDCFWAAHSIFPEHHEVIEFLSIQRPRAMEYYKKAVKFVFEGNKYLAMDNIQKGLELFHDMTRLLLLRAAIFRESRDYDQALSDLERASKFMFAEGLQNDVTVQIGLTYNDMGTSLFQKERYHEAMTILNEAITFMPTDPGIHINRGDTYRELKKFNLAQSDYHYAMDLGGSAKLIHPRLSLNHYALGAQCYNRQDYEGANIEFTRAIEFFDNNPEYYLNRARACMELGHYDTCYQDLKKSLELNPNCERSNALFQ